MEHSMMFGYMGYVVCFGFNNLICLQCDGRIGLGKETMCHTHPITMRHWSILYGIIIHSCVSQHDHSSLKKRSENKSFPPMTHYP